MFASFDVRSLRHGIGRPAAGLRGVFVLALVVAFFAVPAIAHGAKGTTTHASLTGPAGYCWNYDAAAGPAVGKVAITTSTAAEAGFHSVRVDIKLRADQVPAGAYQVWLVNLYRDEAGQVVGCAASPFEGLLTVKSGSSSDFRGAVERYTGQYELQVYVGPIWGPGFGTAPAIVDVP